MTNEASTDSRFEGILSARSAEVAALARRVQTLVRETLPDLDWVPNHGQEGIGFGINQYGHDGWGVGVIGVAKNWVTLGFMRGAQLPDPHGIVEGTGRNVRHVKVRTAQALDERKDAIVSLLRAATGVSARAAVQGALDLGELEEPTRHSALSAERSQVGRAAQGARLAAQAASAPPVAKKASTKQPIVKKPIAKKPATKKPATKKPATKKPVAKKPATKKPVAKKPAAKKPATKKPATKKPATKKPATKKPSRR